MISSPIKEKLFKVAILGRPNVGKSTLFNRLLGKHRAITDPTPGVTRDAVESECTIDDSRFLLVDTGGFNLETGEMQKCISDRSVRIASEAGLILLVVDVNSLSGEDYTFIEQIRKFEEKLILVINKVDSRKQEDSVWNFFELGFNRLLGVSAEHNRNIRQLKKLILDAARQAAPYIEEAEKDYIRLSILGKPNTGKSTLLNLLLNEEKALVSEKPGTTRDTIEGRLIYKEIPFQVIDTAGIRRKGKITDAVEYYSVNRAIRSINESDIVFLLIEAREGLSEQDKKIASLVGKKGRGIIFVLNKWDLLIPVPNQLNAIKDRIHFLFPVMDFVPVLPLSALTGEGIRRLLDTSIKLWKQLHYRVDTSHLNQALKDWVRHYSLPVRGRNVKIHYATQVGINPVEFIFFVNHLKAFPLIYKRYLKNRIQQDLGFGNIHIHLKFKED